VFSKILIANRGEIALRIIRACHDLGVTAVGIHSVADRGALHVRSADESLELAGASDADGYLDVDQIVALAVRSGAEAVHPGYGFLAENASFAAAVEAAGLAFVGPPSAAIDAMGEKVRAREIAAKAGVPQVPGTSHIADGDDVVAFGDRVGYPLAIKASYGGGGRGMRKIFAPEEAAAAFASARDEARSAFGRDDLYVERYLESAHHVEVQVFADTFGNAVWLGDRDCSVQRRHQKLVEEAPADVSAEVRRQMGEASVRLVSEVGYVGAGTVEYLVEGDEFYFLEMNTRIQVEHTITEEVLGIDLVVEQIRVAAGEKLSFGSSGPDTRGHAIECRINAEDVTGLAFAPVAGGLQVLDVPSASGLRFDSGYETGDQVLPYYDSLIGKLVVWGPTREVAIRRTIAALESITVTGVPTTIPALEAIIEHPDFAAGAVTTEWVENSDGLKELVEARMGTTQSRRDVVTVLGRTYVVPRFARDGVTVVNREALREAATLAATGSTGRQTGTRDPSSVESPMQGVLVTSHVSDGDAVTAGQVLFVVEAMKMQIPITAGIDGTIESLSVKVGDRVATESTLARIVT
jgi:acetyl-CoA/propionyl-CoA carboxylase biotin carboxyl carrier protein